MFRGNCHVITAEYDLVSEDEPSNEASSHKVPTIRSMNYCTFLIMRFIFNCGCKVAIAYI